jgi:tetratricopeptide (TPR) repeat protein
MKEEHGRRLSHLLTFLEHDGNNPQLLADAAAAAFDEQAFDVAADLIERHAALAPLSDTLLNLKGLVALARERFADAAGVFEQLRARADEPALRFNLAWAKARLEQYDAALKVLDDAAVEAAPRGPSLKIHIMHHLNLHEEALAEGDRLVARFPEDEALMGALSTLALDAEKPELALQYAKRAGCNPEGQATLGFLVLGQHDAEQSLPLFESALARQPANPRAWVGKGLGLLSCGQPGAGAEAIDHGAALFGNHVGSWIASGWAHFIAGDQAKARASFQRALAMDDNFSETHGALAVLDLMDGRLNEARRQCDVALRLDKNSFGGALAKSMLLEASGHPQAAQKVRDLAMATPVGPDGQTLAHALLAMSSHLGR